MHIRTTRLLLLLTAVLTTLTIAHAAEPKPALPLQAATAVPVVTHKLIQPKGASGPDRYAVVLRDAPVASYAGGIDGLDATRPSETGDRRLNVDAPASKAYTAYLERVQRRLVADVAQAIQRDPELVYQFQHALNAVVLVLEPDEAAAVAALPEVVRVERDAAIPLQTDAGPGWIGAPAVWNGSATGGAGSQGEGIVVGIIDSGINTDHPSFAAVGGDGYAHLPLPGGFVGWCDPADPNYDATLVCNNKLIGMRDYADASWAGTGDAESDGPEDSIGHGSHTASTAAGNIVDATLYGPTTSVLATISGVAPHAYLIAYDVCATSCFSTDVVAAVDDAIVDGVDVINESIGLAGDMWNGIKQQAYLAAFDAGIFYARSAGNDGPGAGTVGPEPPWVTAVAATTHNRRFVNSLTDLTSSGPSLSDFFSLGFTAGYGPAPILYAGDLGDYNGNGTDDSNALCGLGGQSSYQSPWPGGFFKGEIIVCDRGVYGRVEKGVNLAFSGAGGYVLVNAEANGEAVTGDAHALPAIHLGYTDGVILKQWIAANSGTTASIRGAEVDKNAAYADIVGDFSSRGPADLVDLLLPDVAAPGLDIWAAVNNDDGVTPEGEPEYGLQSGTSMASPHAAGAAALLMSLHPDWTPAEIKSALMSTAQNSSVRKEDGLTPADPFDIGAGRLDLASAAAVGLVLNETGTRFAAADPSAGGDPGTLNLPGMVSRSCTGQCTWTRTVRSVLSQPATWDATLVMPEGMSGSVAPEQFTLNPGASQELEITLDSTRLPDETWYFAQLSLMPSRSGVSPQHMPIALMPGSNILPDQVRILTRRNAGSQLVRDLVTFEIPALTTRAFGLVRGEETGFALAQDPTNIIAEGEMYDNLSQVYWTTLQVAGNSPRLVAEIARTTSPDVDLALGFDINGDGLPSHDEEVCLSAGPSWEERCDLEMPRDGRWWVVVQNWQASGVGVRDDVALVTAVVPTTDRGNLSFDPVPPIPAQEPFDLRLRFDLEQAEANQRWYGVFSLGSDADNQGNIGTIPVDILRIEDDVSKSARVRSAQPGSTIDFEIVVQPNTLSEDIAYEIFDRLPQGLTFVPGSASASKGSVTVEGSTLAWTGTLISPASAGPSYIMTTSASDPLCDTGFDGYLDLASLPVDPPIRAQEVINGDTVAFTAFSAGSPITFFGENHTGLTFTDDGFAIFNFRDNYGGEVWVPQKVPNAGLPNNLAAPFWQDLEIFYNEALNHGVSLATAGDELIIIEYDDIQFYGGSADTFDFEMIMRRSESDEPGDYEIVFAYDNLKGSLAGPLTVGVENAAGSVATALVNNASGVGALSNGLMVCFDAVRPGQEPVVISYRARVDANMPLGTYLDSTILSRTDNLGSKDTTSIHRLFVGYSSLMPFVHR